MDLHGTTEGTIYSWTNDNEICNELVLPLSKDKDGNWIEHIKNTGLVQTANPDNQFLVIEKADGTTVVDDQHGHLIVFPKFFDYIGWTKNQTELIHK